MKPTLVPDAGKVARRSWSLHLMALSGLLQGAYQCWPSFDWLPWWSSLAVLALAYGARFVAQRGLSLPERKALEEAAGE